MIEEILKEIEVSLRENFKEVFETLQPGASQEQLDLLREKCFDNNELPKDLEAIYRWHNGQTGYGSLNPNDNRTFLSIEEVIHTWEFLNDPADMDDRSGPISKTWIPFTHNGAGDHLVYETDGENKGKILKYWHDDEARSVQNDSLVAWLQEVLAASKS